ncbi:MAG: PQQ-dependent catabolism-associated beta-propeller protein [Bryobacterales bacterium]|nr:PQQ-dependent catabolism-associated beta-propeller protein [Bryobacterales bacterium]
MFRSILLTGLIASLATAAPTHRLFVSNEVGDSVTVIDSRSGEVQATVTVGGRPRGIGFSPDRKYVYVALGDDNAIAVIDAQTLKVERKIPAGSDPEAFAVHQDGTIYLSNEDEGLASALDPSTGEILAEIKVGLEPEGVGVSPDGKQVLVTSESSNMVHVISVSEKKLVANILVGARPREVAFSPDGTVFWVTSEVAGHVSKVDRASNKVVAVNNRLRREINPRVKPKGVLLSHDGSRLYISLGRGNAVAALDPDTLAVQATAEVGVRAWGLALSRDGKRLYTANGPDATVSVVDTESMKEVATIPTGEMPWGLALDD